MYKKLLAKPQPIVFPDYCYLSRNYYNKVRERPPGMAERALVMTD